MSVRSNTLNHSSSLVDEDFISCDNCRILFEKNEKEHNPDYGKDCYHSFCRPCIGSQTSSNTKAIASCPICTFSEKNSKKQKMLCSNNPDWCSNCNIAASLACRKSKHVILSVNDLYIERSQKLKILVNETNIACDHTLKDFSDIQSLHKVILAWIGWLQQKISQWNSSNTATIAQLESLKTTMEFHVPLQKDASSTIKQINQLIAEFDHKHLLAGTIQIKGTNLIQLYRKAKWGTTQPAELSGPNEWPPRVAVANWFSTALSRDHKSCRDVLSFLVRLLNKEESVPGNIPAPKCSSDGTLLTNQNNQVKENSSLNTEKANAKDIQRVQKRQLEEVIESRTQLSKKIRLQSPDRTDNKHERKDLHTSQGAVNPAFKEEMKLQVATVNKELSQLAHKLQEAEDKSKLMKEDAGVLTEEKTRYLKEKEILLVRHETDLTLLAEKVQLTKDSEATANQDSSILFKLARKTGENYEMVLILSTADVEQLNYVRKRLDQNPSQLAIVLQERKNKAASEGNKNPIIDQSSVEKRCHQLQKQVQEMKEALRKSTTETAKTRQSNSDLLLERIQLKEEVRKAKEESRNLQSKMIATDANHVQELNQCRNYKTRLDWLQMEFKKVFTESPIFFNHRYCTVPDLVAVKRKMQLILKKVEDEQIEKHNEKEDKFNQADHLLTASREQRIFERDPVQQAVPILQRQLAPNVIMPQKIVQLQVYNFNAIAADILMELYRKGTNLLYYSCTICKSLVETRFYCNKCRNFIVCIPCYEKEKHCHKMDILGFDLDVQKLPSGCKDIEEARHSKIERRIHAFFHGLQCLDFDCRKPFCKSMKLIIKHCYLCKFKLPTSMTENSFDLENSCAICRELVALIVYHAKLCTQPICQVPHCSSAKKRIRITKSKLLEIREAQGKERSFKEQSSESRPPLMPNNVINPGITEVLSHDNLNGNHHQQENPLTLVNDVPVLANQPVARVAPYVEASPGGSTINGVRSIASDADKRQIVRENIILIIHAHVCRNQRQQCPIRHCLAMKNVLHHVRTCESSQRCIPHCRSTRIIISHLKNCCLTDCMYCFAMMGSDRYNAITGPNPIVIASELPSSNISSATERVQNLPQLANYYPGPTNSIQNSRVL